MLKVSKLIGHCTTVLMNMMMTIADMNGDDVTHCCLTNQLIKALGIQLSSHLVFGDCDNWNCVDNNDDDNDQALCIIKGP